MTISYNPLHVCTRSYNSFTVLYDLKHRQLLLLEAVSADIWSFITSKNNTTVDEITDHISEIYDCSSHEISDDIVDFLQDLFDTGIIQFDGAYCQFDESIINNTHFNSDNDDLEGQIIQSLESENQLYSATIEMTYACNEKCFHCYAHYPSSNPTSESVSFLQYQKFIDELYTLGTLHIAFTGGDPFMYPNFLEVFKYSRYKGFVTDIFTNGIWLAEHPQELEDILALSPRAFYISLYGSSPSLHDCITGVPGSFDKTIGVVKKIHGSNIPVVFNMMILTENYHDLNRMIALVNDIGVEYRVSMSLIYRNDGSDSPMKHFINDKQIIKHVLRTIQKKAFSVDRPIDKTKVGDHMCNAALTSICLSPDGTVYPCVSLKTPLGNIKKNSVSEIWHSSVRFSIVDFLKWDNTKECNYCPNKTDCPHCAGMSQAETGDMLSCNTCDKLISECLTELHKEASNNRTSH